MSQTRKITGRATSIGTDLNGNMYVQYHSTRVVEWNQTSIILRSGGYQTTTTRTRMNQTANQFGLGFQVFQKSFEWFVEFKGQTLPFHDGMTLNRG